MLDTECSPKVEPVEKQKRTAERFNKLKENCWLLTHISRCYNAKQKGTHETAQGNFNEGPSLMVRRPGYFVPKEVLTME